MPNLYFFKLPDDTLSYLSLPTKYFSNPIQLLCSSSPLQWSGL